VQPGTGATGATGAPSGKERRPTTRLHSTLAHDLSPPSAEHVYGIWEDRHIARAQSDDERGELLVRSVTTAAPDGVS
jgi:hypothetical protein